MVITNEDGSKKVLHGGKTYLMVEEHESRIISMDEALEFISGSTSLFLSWFITFIPQRMFCKMVIRRYQRYVSFMKVHNTLQKKKMKVRLSKLIIFLFLIPALSFGQDCTYKMKKPYSLAYNSFSKDYVICQWGERYMYMTNWIGGDTIEVDNIRIEGVNKIWFTRFVEDAMKFTDTCLAKTYMKAYDVWRERLMTKIKVDDSLYRIKHTWKKIN